MDRFFKHLPKIFYKIMAGVLGRSFGSFLAPAKHFLQNHQTENHGRSFGPKFWLLRWCIRGLRTGFTAPAEDFLQNHGRSFGPKFWAEGLAACVVYWRIVDRLSSTCQRFSTKSWPEFWAEILGRSFGLKLWQLVWCIGELWTGLLAPAEHFLQNLWTENHGQRFGPKFWAEFLAAWVEHLRIMDRLSNTC